MILLNRKRLIEFIMKSNLAFFFHFMCIIWESPKCDES